MRKPARQTYLQTTTIATCTIFTKDPSLYLVTGNDFAFVKLGGAGETAHTALAGQAMARFGGSRRGVANGGFAYDQQEIPSERRQIYTRRVHIDKQQVELKIDLLTTNWLRLTKKTHASKEINKIITHGLLLPLLE
jgi:hypothetical protein